MTLTNDPSNVVMTIGELARRTGMSIKALRRLECMGLIYTVGRSPAGYRLFDEEALWCVNKYRTLRGLGLTVAEIRRLGDAYLTQPERPYLAELLRAVRARVDARIAELVEIRRRIDDFEKDHHAALARLADGGLFADDPRVSTRGCQHLTLPRGADSRLPRVRVTVTEHREEGPMTAADIQQLAFDELADAWVGWFKEMIPEEFRRLVVPMAREMATGQPLAPQRLADLAGLPLERTLAVLREAGIEVDPSGERLLDGFMLTTKPTPHRNEVHGHTLWTYCAGDSLLLPVLISAPVRTVSPCAATGDPITIDLTPTGVERIEPAGAVVSVVAPATDLANAVEAVCDQQNFYRSAEVAAPWQAKRPQGRLLPVAEAFEIFRRGVIELWGEELTQS